MIRSLYTAVSGLVTQEAKQDIITSNLANANTTGYKSENLAVKKFEDVLLSNYDKKVLNKNQKNTLGTISLGSKIDETLSYFTQGTLVDTNSATDFGLYGRGFFTVQGQNGSTYYTRDGGFHVDLQGYLTSKEGYRVLGIGANGQQQPIYVGDGKLSVDKSGNIAINGNNTYKFAISDFENYDSLKKVGDNLYSGQNATLSQNFMVNQNSLEASNVNTVSEMVNMMTTMRQFETNQKMVQMIDESLGKAVNEVGVVR